MFVWVGAAVLVSIVAGPAVAVGETLTAADVVRLAGQRDPAIQASLETVALAEAARVGAGMLANPSLDWEREKTSGGGETTVVEDSLALALPIDLSSRRRTGVALADSTVAETRAAALRTRSATVVHALTTFFSIVAERRRASVERGMLADLNEASRVVTRRRGEGTASGYDQARIEIEAAMAEGSLRQFEARIESLHQELSALLAVDPRTTVYEGALDSDPSVSDAPAGGAALTDRPSLLAVSDAAGDGAKAREAARFAWLPALTVSGGARSEEADRDRDGYVAGLSVELPLFSRGQDLVAEAAARERFTRAQQALAQRDAAIAHETARLALAASRAELQRFEATTGDGVVVLQKAAESGYREGERSIVELIDARRVRQRVDLRRLDLELSIKGAEIALRAALGEFE